MKVEEKIKVKEAVYINDFMLSIAFNDGKKKVVDFKPFLDTIQTGFLEKYKKVSNFKKFNIENGNIVWGKDWDLIFPVPQLHRGKILI